MTGSRHSFAMNHHHRQRTDWGRQIYHILRSETMTACNRRVNDYWWRYERQPLMAIACRICTSMVMKEATR